VREWPERLLGCKELRGIGHHLVTTAPPGIRQPLSVCGVAGVQDMPFSEVTTIGAAVLAMHSGDSMATINVS